MRKMSEIFKDASRTIKKIRDRCSEHSPEKTKLYLTCVTHQDKIDYDCRDCLTICIMHAIRMNWDYWTIQGYEPVWRHRETHEIIHEDHTLLYELDPSTSSQS